MIDPLFWLGLSILLVAVSLTAVLVAALPALQELARAARSVEKLADTLRRELPPTLEAIRLTGMEISDLTDDINEGVNSAGQVVKQVDRSIESAKQQATKVQVTTKSVFTGIKAAWKSFTRQPPSTDAPRHSAGRLRASQRPPVELGDRLSQEKPSRTHDSYLQSRSLQTPETSNLPSDTQDVAQQDLEIESTPPLNLPPSGPSPSSDRE